MQGTSKITAYKTLDQLGLQLNVLCSFTVQS